MTDEAKAAAETLCRLLNDAGSAVVLTGAGASAPSGVPTYRGAGGAWTRYDPDRYASIDYFRIDPSYYWNFFKDERYPSLKNAGPNPIHFALAELEKREKISAIITQNIDGLHRAGGSKRVLELHGNSRRFLCESCGHATDFETVHAALDTHLPPHCPECDEAALRPDVVLFGEALAPRVLNEAIDAINHTGLVIVVGSSLQVHPAASLPIEAMRNGATLAILNIDPTPLDELATLLVREPADRVLPLVQEQL